MTERTINTIVSERATTGDPVLDQRFLDETRQLIADVEQSHHIELASIGSDMLLIKNALLTRERMTDSERTMVMQRFNAVWEHQQRQDARLDAVERLLEEIAPVVAALKPIVAMKKDGAP